MLRLGFLVDFLSHAAITGFMGGAAIVIGLQQLKGLLGLSHFTSNTDIVSVTRAVWVSVHEPVSILPFCSLSMDTERYLEKKSSNERIDDHGCWLIICIVNLAIATVNSLYQLLLIGQPQVCKEMCL